MKARECKYELKQLFPNFQSFLTVSPPFADKQFDEGWYEDVMNSLPDYQVLVVGAGGLGCQVVKNLALSGIRKIHLVDMDTIDLTNLNRQFLFRHKDINRMKAEVVAEFVMKRCPGVQVIPHVCRVQELNYNFYQQFGVIIGGLDNIEARKFLNTMVHQINEDNQDDQTACFFIDGATQGFEGQCVVVEPFKTSCYNCSLLDGIGEKPKANYCTIAHTPRTPEHCVQYVLQLEWDKYYPDTKRDNDNLEHMKWVYQKSLERAKKFKIEGVTQMLTMGVTKNIIPAIASTNALIAAFCTNQAMKIITASNPMLRNYFFYRGGTSAGSDSYQIMKKPGCRACEMRVNKLEPIKVTMPSTATFAQLIKLVHDKNNVISAAPFVNVNQKMIYNPSDIARKQLKEKKTMKQLLDDRVFMTNPQLIIITDNSLKSQQKVIVTISEEQINQ